MRVLWIHQNLVDRDQAGNARGAFLLDALARAGVEADVVCGATGYLGRTRDGDTAPVERAGIHIHRVPVEADPARRGASYGAFLRQANRVWPRLPKPDVVFCSSPPLPQAWSCLRAARHFAVPMVLEVRDLWPAYLEACGLVTSWIPLRGLEALESAAVRGAAAVISASPAYGDYLESLGAARPVRTVLSGADPAWLETGSVHERGAWRKQHGLEGKFVALYAGSLHRHYRPDLLMEAARIAHARNPSVTLVVAGGGRCGADVAAAAAADSCIRYLGPVPRIQVQAALADADIAITILDGVPLLETAVPGKLFDAMACAVPVINGARGEAARLVEDSGCGVNVSEVDSAALAEAMLSLAADPARTRAMGDRGRAWASAHCRADGQAEIILEVMRDGARRGRPPHPVGLLIRGLRDALAGRTRRRLQSAFPAAFQD